jgi:hypothetical protein
VYLTLSLLNPRYLAPPRNLIDRIVDAATGISDRHALFVHLYVIRWEKIECVEAEGGRHFNILMAVKTHFPRPGYVKSCIFTDYHFSLR